MSKVCSVCGKGPMFGKNVSHSNKRTPRVFEANVKKVRAVVNGSTKNIMVCAKCMKAGKVVRAI